MGSWMGSITLRFRIKMYESRKNAALALVRFGIWNTSMSDGRQLSRNPLPGFLPVQNLDSEMRTQDTHKSAGSSDRVGSLAAPAYIFASAGGILYKPGEPGPLGPLGSSGMLVAVAAACIAQDLINQIRSSSLKREILWWGSRVTCTLAA